MRFGSALAVAAALLLGSQAARADPRPDVEQRADALVGTFARAGSFQGVVLLAVEGKVIYERAFGKASLELDVPNTPDLRFHIASVSKPFTAAAIQILAERGKLDLHAPLARVLPGYPHGDQLTLDHLLTHTSGIPNINAFAGYDDWSKDAHSAEELVQHFRDQPLGFEPGERYDYSNSNYNLLAHIVETVSGQPYGEFLAANIFRPLAMDDTAHRGDMSRLVPRLAAGHVPVAARGFGRAPYLDWTIKTGNGSLVSTARDLLKFDQALLKGGLLQPESLEAAYGFERDLGYGWFTGERFGERRVYISGRSPGYTANFERFIDRDRCFVVLSNLYLGAPAALLEGLAAILLDKDHSAPGFDLDYKLTAARVAGPSLDRFTGRYAFGESWFAGAVSAAVHNRRDHLAVVYLDGQHEGYEFPLVPLGEATFFDRKHGGIVRFEPRDPKETEPSSWTLVYSYGNEWRAEPVPTP